MNPYIGHDSQLSRIEEHRLVGGKGDGIRLLEADNGRGLQLTISPDRNADIARLRCKGMNMGYFSPCGYAAPSYYEANGNGWLKTFTAGFLTTCGLQSVGTPCTDEGEELPMHGSIANLPAESTGWEREENYLTVTSMTPDEVLFGRKLRLYRTIRISLEKNSFTLTDVVENTGDRTEPVEILYHMNMGYPLLDEDSVLRIPSVNVRPRDEHAANDLEHWMRMEPPQKGYRERCYYHEMKDKSHPSVSIYQPKQKLGLAISYDGDALDCFVEWKMMGFRDYVLGLECGNCYPDGRDIMRKNGILKFLEPGEKKTYRIKVSLLEGDDAAADAEI